MGRRYTQEQLEFLSANAKYDSKKITAMFNERFKLNKQANQINSICCYYGFRKGIDAEYVRGFQNGSIPYNKNGLMYYTTEQVNFLAENAKSHNRREMLELYNAQFSPGISFGQLLGLIRRNGIRLKPNRDTPDTGQEIIVNRKERLAKSSTGRHRISHCTKSVGTERIFQKDGKSYVLVKTSKGDWEYKQRLIYESVYGQIPKGNMVIFADGNTFNFSPENLVLVSPAAFSIARNKKLLYKNTELTKSGVEIAKLYLKINERQKKASKNQKQEVTNATNN